MSSPQAISKLRNIGIMAHIDAGKTTTTERFLYYAGYLHKIGQVDEGTAFMDYMDQEKERGITITAAATTCFWHDCQINIVDTPGHVDFTAEVQRSLRVLDGAIAIFCARGGVEPQSETVWHQAENFHVPKIAYINKLDRLGADFGRVLKMMVDKLGANPVPIQIPMGIEDQLEGIIDLIKMKALYFDTETQGEIITEADIPEKYLDQAKEYHSKMIESISETSDELLMKYLEGEELTCEEIKTALRNATLSLKLNPVLCGSSLKNIGVQPLLDSVIDYLPSPLEVKYFDGFDPENHEKTIKRLPSLDEPFSALAFKILSDQFVDKLTFIRVYSGILKVGSSVLNSATGKKEKILRIMKMFANRREDVQELSAGDIGAIPSLRYTRTGDTLCDVKHPILYEKIFFADPVINQSIEARTLADQEKLLISLQKLSEEDPTFKFKNDEDSGQIIISGVGELHLEVLVERLKREFKIPAKVGKPQVAYRETITIPIQHEGHFERPGSGKNHFANVKIEMAPAERNKGIKVESILDPKKISQVFIDSIKNGVQESLQVGPNGYPVIDIFVRIIDATFNEENNIDMTYKIAASIAVKEAMRQAQPVLLEPVFEIEVVSPEDYVGDIISDINSRRGRIEGIDHQGKAQIIKAFAPLSEMFGYVTKLRSLSQGRASYTMTFSHYEPAAIKN
jgi:elongation factor G